jgi:hypothetical protein
MDWGVIGVNWLRTKAKKLSLLALFALALQLGLSFGHTHAEVILAGVSVSAGQSQASTPDTDHDQDVHRDLCAICATMAMVNTLAASAAPSLQVPLTVTALQTSLHPQAIAADSRRGAFHSRAPPLS